MTLKKKKIAVPLTIQGRSFVGTGSIRQIVLYILENALKYSGRN